MVTLATLLVLLGCMGAGYGVLVAASGRARGWIETAALAFLLGVALSAAVGTALIAAAGPPSGGAVRAGLGLGVAVGLVALVVQFRRRRASAPQQEGPAREAWTTADRLLAAAASAFCVFALFYASSMPMHVFDPVYHFAYKGKLVAHEGFGTESWTDVDGPVGRIITHPNYPPALPVLHALVGGAGTGFSEDATRPLMGVFAAAAVGLLFVALRGRGRRPALLGALSLAGLPLLYYSQLPRHPVSWSHTEAEFVGSLRAEPEAAAASVIALLVGAENAMVHLPRLGPYRQPDGWTLDGAADLPLAALLLAAAWCLGRGRTRGAAGEGSGGAGDLVLAGVLLAGAGLMKNEGLALGLLALVVYGLVALVSGGLRGMLRLWPAAALFALLLVPWMVLRRDIPSIDEDYPRAIARVFGAGADEVLGPLDHSPRSVGEALGRVPVVVFGFVQSCLNPLRWNLVWVLFGVVFVWRLWRPRQLLVHPLFAPLLLVLATIAAYAVILVVTPWELPRLYTTAIPDRLLLHVVPLALWCSFGLAWRRSADGADPGPRQL